MTSAKDECPSLSIRSPPWSPAAFCSPPGHRPPLRKRLDDPNTSRAAIKCRKSRIFATFFCTFFLAALSARAEEAPQSRAAIRGKSFQVDQLRRRRRLHPLALREKRLRASLALAPTTSAPLSRKAPKQKTKPTSICVMPKLNSEISKPRSPSCAPPPSANPPPKPSASAITPSAMPRKLMTPPEPKWKPPNAPRASSSKPWPPISP